MRALLFAVLFTTACTTDHEKATKRDPAPTSSVAAQRAADDKATEDEQARNAARVDVDTARAATEAATAKAHAQTGAQLQRDFDAADRRFNALKVKAASATGAAKRGADAATVDATAREASVMAGIAKLRDATGAAWDTTKAQTESDLVALSHALDSLENALK